LTEEGRPGPVRGERAALAREVEPVLAPQPSEPGEVFAPKDWAEGLDRRQEVLAARLPVGPLAAQPAARHDAVHVNMLRQGLPPSMEYGGDPELRSEMLRVTGKLLQGLGRGLKQQVVEGPLIDPNQGIEQMGEGKDDVEVGHRQE
jgi:hypothetical protein